MITIDHFGKGYQVKFSAPGTGMRSYKVKANNVEEIHLAIDHHLGVGDRTQEHINDKIGNCPLCRS